MRYDPVTVGAYEAKTNLAAILDAVEQGREYVITRHGKPVARMSPEKATVSKETLVQRMMRSREIASRCTLDGISIKELRDAGRKW